MIKAQSINQTDSREFGGGGQAEQKSSGQQQKIVLVFGLYLRIQQFDLIAMNFFALPANTYNLRTHLQPLQQTRSLNPKPSILSFMAIVLAMDFTRFENLIRSKIILQELAPKPTLEVQDNKPLPSLPDPPKTQISAADPVPKTTQKVLVPKTPTPVKPQIPKNTVIKQNQIKPQAPSKNEIKLEATAKVPVGKNSKKIHKVSEPRKENLKRQLDVCLLDAAEMPKWRITQREKRRICERLLLRQVSQWHRPNEQKRQRRDLRPLH